jgi:acetylornithine deacetylase/succinyl-diaminopimelate desuccinylase-like protein
MNADDLITPVELLRQLIWFDTTNPPGNEAPCVAFIDELLRGAGIATTVLGRTSERANLVARLEGRGDAPPLLLYGHVDVVTTANQRWTHPPFEGRVVDGYIWGRGALDMKGPLALMISAMLRAKCQEGRLPGDVILAVLADEEDGGDFGARYLVENYAELFHGIRYALGEFGGFPLDLGGKRFYPIMVAEKQMCWMTATLRGRGGHGSIPVRGQSMAKLGRFLTRLDQSKYPVHITPVTRQMIEQMASAIGGLTGLALRMLLFPAMTDRLLAVLGERGQSFYPLFHNTVSPTILECSDKVNVIPGQVTVQIDGRLLPGYQPQDLLAELRAIVGEDVEFDVFKFNPGPAEPDMTQFDLLAGVLKSFDPSGIAIPLMLSGVTDARFFSRLGIQTYGFTPLKLPSEFNFLQTVHSADERVPVEAMEFGTQAIYRVLEQWTDRR